MNTFKKYLSVFLVIGAFVFIIGLILIIKDKRLFNWTFIAFFIFAISIYVFPMSLFFSMQASTVEIRIDDTSSETIEKIEEVSLKKCNRNNKECYDNIIVYSMSDKFCAWLTNPIEVSKHSDYIIINVPRAYERHFKPLLSDQSK